MTDPIAPGVARDVGWPVYLVEHLPQGAREVLLDGDEGRHAVAVRRHRPGEVLVVSDGRGHWAAGPVAEVRGRDSLLITVAAAGLEPAPDPVLTVVQALPKSDRADEAVELLTAVGVDRIVPWQAARCITRWTGDRVDRGLRRWRRAGAEAAKQSRRVRMPEVTAPVTGTAELVEMVAAADAAFLCHERATDPMARAAVARSGSLVLIVGPEGGVTDDEVAVLVAAGAQPVTLGPTVLRSAVAGSVAATVVLAAAGRLG